jgi:hypothetical protein
MKVIFYIADGLSPTAIKNPYKKENFYFDQKINNNFINSLAKRSTFFSNCYGGGETFSVTSSMFSGKDPYQIYTDAFYLNQSFKTENYLAKFFKKKKFFNIYYSNLPSNSPIIDNEYERYFKLASQYFDIKIIKKKFKNYSFDNFVEEYNIKENISQHKDIFFLIHENSFHDDPNVYKNSNPKKYLQSADKLSKLFEYQLKKIKFDEKKDVIYFVSDHGLLLRPNDQIYLNKDLSVHEYNKYYLTNLLNERLKFCFFIKNPIKKDNIIENFTIPKNIFFYVKENFLSKKRKLKKIKNRSIIISSKVGEQSPYNNFIDKKCFHNQFLYISKKKKISFSKNHPNLFRDLVNNKTLYKKEVDKKFLRKIREYFSIRNKLIKYSFFGITICFKILRKFIRYFK